MSESKFDLKTLIGWVIIILISVFTSSATSTFTKDEKAQDESKINATQQVRIEMLEKNQTALFKLIERIETNSTETHDNVLILMTEHGIKPKSK